MFFEELENVLTQNSFTPPNKSIAYLYLNWNQKQKQRKIGRCVRSFGRRSSSA